MYKVIPEVAARQIIDDYAETCCQVSELTPYNIDSLPTYDKLYCHALGGSLPVIIKANIQPGGVF
ncbi:unnamed protein product [Penicillium nalgiovense]|nr:unnamed protein product [Penicillium nalgiovense]CAG8207155.1 unnamed protein product [Penicillium nalgiovense]CAG8251412.1 unnamed protein product [Penicillium nalgiovense]